MGESKLWEIKDPVHLQETKVFEDLGVCYMIMILSAWILPVLLVFPFCFQLGWEMTLAEHIGRPRAAEDAVGARGIDHCGKYFWGCDG